MGTAAKSLTERLNPFRAPQCGSICVAANKWDNGKLKRFHLTCLTCPLRRVYRGKTDKYVLKKHVLFEADCVNPKGVPVPKNYIAYFLLINTNYMYKYELEPVTTKLRILLLKRILSFCELLAQW